LASTIPRQFSVTKNGKSYRGTYSLNAGIVTVLHTAADGSIRRMSRAADGLKAIAVARAILHDLAAPSA